MTDGSLLDHPEILGKNLTGTESYAACRDHCKHQAGNLEFDMPL